MYDVEEQNGFRAGRSCADSLFTLKQVVEKRIARNMETHVVFIDLTKAYDSVPLTKLWNIMEQQGISKLYIQAVKKLYQNMSVCVKVGNKLSKEIRVTKGLKQGCCIAPTLFKLYLNGALATWRKKCRNMGVPIAEDKLFTLHFADDQAILAEDRMDIDYMLRKLHEEYSRYGLEINVSKTEYVVFGGTGLDLKIGTAQVKNTKTFKYLGVRLTASGGSSDEICSRMGQAKSAIRQLNSLLWSTKITKHTKIRIYKAIVESIGTYGAELWEISKRNKTRIKAMEMEFWRRSCQLTRMDKVRNTEIRARMGIDIDIIETIEVKRLKWYGHIQRMSEERWPKKICEWTPENRRKRGRPRQAWKDDVFEAMENRGLTKEDWRDRQLWKLGCERRRQP